MRRRLRTRRDAICALTIPAATVLVHQLRYLASDGGDAGHVLRAQGDAYAGRLVPWLVAVAALGLGSIAWQLARSDQGTRSPRRLGALWFSAAAAILGGYLVQEGLEVSVGDAHHSLLAQAFGGGGWTAVVFAVAAGLLWALVARGAPAVLARVRRRTKPYGQPRAQKVVVRRRCSDALSAPAARPLARNLAGRAPPLAVSR